MSDAALPFRLPADAVLAERIRPAAGSPLNGPGFVIGTATSSYQIEGAAGQGGRLESIWDRFCRTPGKVLHQHNGDVACDHFNRWQDDLDLLASLNVDAYRLSIAWPRVVQADGRPNEAGIAFYQRLLDGLRARGIQPHVTLYHWDLPQHLEDRGGWCHRDTAQHFADYAALMAQRLGDRVHAWATLNEPWCSAWLGYGNGHHAPGHSEPALARQAMHHLLLGHGLAVPRLRALAPAAQVGTVLNVSLAYPASGSAEDRAACTLYEAYQNAWALDPLMGLPEPAELDRLWPGTAPATQPGDAALIAAPLDFLGLNFYSRAVVQARGADQFDWVRLPGVERTTMDWEVYPQGLEDLLLDFHRRYPGLPPIFITENGMSSDDAPQADGQVLDLQRLAYLQRHFEACGRAMQQGVDVRGYFVWSLLDNFEWAYGYERRFGIVHVDFQTQQRTPKLSARCLATWLAERRAAG
jgi:beta-glucosidase